MDGALWFLVLFAAGNAVLFARMAGRRNRSTAVWAWIGFAGFLGWTAGALAVPSTDGGGRVAAAIMMTAGLVLWVGGPILLLVGGSRCPQCGRRLRAEACAACAPGTPVASSAAE